jgi:3-polyprenyl-4-hydroxybenzoate decarboxylase
MLFLELLKLVDITRDLEKLREDNANDPTKSNLKDWLLQSFGNKNLGSEESIKNAIGANELSAEQRMASYLGFDYPNKFEELLDHVKRIDESTAAMAGPIQRNARIYETMNNFTGLMGNNDYHNTVHTDIIDKLNKELNTSCNIK